MNLGGPWHGKGPFSVVNDFDVFASVHAWSTSNAAGVWPFLPQCNWIQQESCRICLIEGFSKSWAIREVGDSHFGKSVARFWKSDARFLKKVMHVFPETRYIRQNGAPTPQKSDARFFRLPPIAPQKVMRGFSLECHTEEQCRNKVDMSTSWQVMLVRRSVLQSCDS